MAIRGCVVFLLSFLIGCAIDESANFHGERIIRVGDSASLYELVHIVEKWPLVKSAIFQGDDRVCVSNNLSLESLVFFDLEPIDRVSLYNPEYVNQSIPDGSKIYRLGFWDPCADRADYATDPHWILLERNSGFELLSFIQVIE